MQPIHFAITSHLYWCQAVTSVIVKYLNASNRRKNQLNESVWLCALITFVVFPHFISLRLVWISIWETETIWKITGFLFTIAMKIDGLQFNWVNWHARAKKTKKTPLKSKWMCLHANMWVFIYSVIRSPIYHCSIDQLVLVANDGQSS